MFPTLDASEIERVRRFGEVQSIGAGEALARVGDIGHGPSIILAGEVEVTQHDRSGLRTPRHITFASSGGRYDPFYHDFVNHIGLPSVLQFFARSIECPANGANCRIIKNTYGNEPKNRQRRHATPLSAYRTVPRRNSCR
jgi:hypothetical protein